MVLIALNTSFRRRRRVPLLLATLVLGLAVVAAHSALAGGHIGSPAAGHAMTSGGHQMIGGSVMSDADGAAEGPVDALMAMCLAIAETAALALGALAVAGALAALLILTFSLRRPAWPLVLTPLIALAPRARPPDLSVLQVFRR